MDLATKGNSSKPRSDHSLQSLQRVLPFDPKKWQQDLAKTAPAPKPTATKQVEPAPPSTTATTSVADKTTNTDAQITSKLAAFYALEAWKEAWKEKRTKSIFRPISINIEIEDPVIDNLTDNQLLVTFKQSYTSNSYHDIVVKTLTMEKEENGWKIIKEREVKVIRE